MVTLLILGKKNVKMGIFHIDKSANAPKDVTILNLCALNYIATKYIRQG